MILPGDIPPGPWTVYENQCDEPGVFYVNGPEGSIARALSLPEARFFAASRELVDVAVIALERLMTCSYEHDEDVTIILLQKALVNAGCERQSWDFIKNPRAMCDRCSEMFPIKEEDIGTGDLVFLCPDCALKEEIT